MAVDERLVLIVEEYQIASYPDFAVLWFPANVPLASSLITGESLIVQLVYSIEAFLSPQQNRLLPPQRRPTDFLRPSSGIG